MSNKYRPVKNEDSLLDEEADTALYAAPPKSGNALNIMVRVLLLISTIMNLLLIREVFSKSTKLQNLDVSMWSKNARDIPTPIYSSTQYGPAFSTEEDRDRLWESLRWDKGTIALPDTFAIQHGLPLSQRFPWDKSYGVYLLGAFHQIHCLREIYLWASAVHKNQTPEVAYYHVVHCLDSLLQDVYCHADDTPWYELPATNRSAYVKYQTRQCRSWDRLIEWRDQYDACYIKQIRDADGNEIGDMYDHFAHCTPDSRWTSAVKAHFGDRPSVGAMSE